MSINYSAYVRVINNTNRQIDDVQVVLKARELQLKECGSVPPNSSSNTKHGITVYTGDHDWWTVTYKKNSLIYWVPDKKMCLDKKDAGGEVQIIIFDTKVKIIGVESDNSNEWNSERP